MYLNDYDETGSTPPDTEDLINYPRSVEGVEVALLFIEQKENSVKVSFRSRSKIDVDKIAESFGGGGHRLAAGATVPGSMEIVRTRVLENVRKSLEGSLPPKSAPLSTESGTAKSK